MYIIEKIKNKYVILVILFFLGLGYVSAYYIQDQKISGIIIENNSTINTYNKLVNELNKTVNIMNDELDALEIKMFELETKLTQKNNEYDALVDKNGQLNNSYSSLLNEYYEMNASIMVEREFFLNRTSVSDDGIRVFFNGISFEYPKTFVTSLSGLYESVPNNNSGLFTGTSYDEDTIITISWNYIENAPDINATLRNAYESIKKDVKKIGTNNSLVKDDIIIRYVNYTVSFDGETKYMLISSWYMRNSSHHYLCVVQRDENNVIEIFKDLMKSFYEL